MGAKRPCYQTVPDIYYIYFLCVKIMLEYLLLNV